MNTSQIENFTIDFAKEYFSWKNNKLSIEQRMKKLGNYLTNEDLALVQEMVRADIPTSVQVDAVKILDVNKTEEGFVVSFVINQKITEKKENKAIRFGL
ncbi:conjugal transfer protein [Enterococcus sp. AZ194]|uniref:conjugal transfer protein n=1 Tax=Enterococcus sp. AZ194 TaxID=2774629 RepID=UPI003F688423